MASIADQTGRAWADVNLRALVANARTVAARSGARLLPMVKANGYGVGAVACARALEAVDPWGFGVGTVEEGAELRAAGVTRPILVFTPLAPVHVARHLTYDLRPVIADADALAAWLAAGSHPFHIELDTGMARSGFRRLDSSVRELLRGAPGWEGAFTHFHSPNSDPAATARQWEALHAQLDLMAARPPLIHAANSAVALGRPQYAGTLVRPGIFLYGGDAGGYSPEPVVRLSARVVALRDIEAGETVSYGATWTAAGTTRVATIAIGYADGIHRSLSNQGIVELGGRIVPLIGRVTMDFVMAAVDPSCALGDVAVLFGGLVSLDEQARRAGTISYELLTAMGPRVVRRYS